MSDSDKNRFVRRNACPLCQTPVELARLLFHVQQLTEKMPVLLCPTCGLAFKASSPSPDLLAQIYGEHYAHYQPADERTVLRGTYERVQRMGSPRGKKHLDYGCGSGDFVRGARHWGWESYGADPMLPQRLLQRDEKHFFRYSADTEAHLVQGPFDVITLWAVVEHLEHPLAVFRHLVDNLKDGGTILYNVPNAESLAARKHGSRWEMALLLEHTLFFTTKTVDYLAHELGLEIVTQRTCGFPYPLGLVASGQSEEQMEKGSSFASGHAIPRHSLGIACFKKKCVRFLRRASTWPVIRSMMRMLVDRMGTGDHLFIVMKKSPLHEYVRL